MNFKIEVFKKTGVFDSAGEGVKKDIADLNIKSVEKVITSEIYIISGRITDGDIEKIGRELLIDPVVQDFRFKRISSYNLAGDENTCANRTIEVGFKLGVTDAVAETVQKGVKDMGIDGVDFIRTVKKFALVGNISKEEINLIKRRLLVNDIINESVIY